MKNVVFASGPLAGLGKLERALREVQHRPARWLVLCAGVGTAAPSTLPSVRPAPPLPGCLAGKADWEFLWLVLRKAGEVSVGLPTPKEERRRKVPERQHARSPARPPRCSQTTGWNARWSRGSTAPAVFRARSARSRGPCNTGEPGRS